MPIEDKIKQKKVKNYDGMFFTEVGLRHRSLRKWNPTMSIFLGITEIIF